jgi:two-component system, NtrC family, sensor kinase
MACHNRLWHSVLHDVKLGTRLGHFARPRQNGTFPAPSDFISFLARGSRTLGGSTGSARATQPQTHRMRIGSRLLLVLLPSIGIIMLAYGVWALAQREAVARLEIREDTEIFAATLGLAIGNALSPDDDLTYNRILAQVRRGNDRYFIAVYDIDGESLFPIDPHQRFIPLQQLRDVIESGDAVGLEANDPDPRYSILVPIRDAVGFIRGVLEVTHPLELLQSERADIQRRFVLNTLTLLLGAGLATWALVHRSVSQPLSRFVEAARAVGGGNLNYRLSDHTRIRELDILAGELNRMAVDLDTARRTDVERAKEQLSLERRLRVAEKAATVGKLSAGLAHEIAAPLNVIAGRADLLRTPMSKEESDRNINIIVQQIQRITTIVRSLLNYAGRRAPNVGPVDLTTVLASAMEFLDHEFRAAGIEVELDVPESVPITADRDLLHEVFVNLLLNATQAMEPCEPPRRLTIRVNSADPEPDCVSVDVIDTGPGIPPDVRHRLFDPFFTTKTSGTGLGLFMCRSIVEEHGGTLQVDSDTKHGAHFRVILPVDPTRPPAADA